MPYNQSHPHFLAGEIRQCCRWVMSGIVTSDCGAYEIGVIVCGVLDLRVRPGNQIVQSFPLKSKSEESTKHYLTQMLLAIN